MGTKTFYTCACTYIHCISCICTYMYMYMFLMRDEKEERKKQARSNKQTGHMYMLRQLIFLRKSDCLGCAVLLCLVCLFDLACFFLSSLI